MLQNLCHQPAEPMGKECIETGGFPPRGILPISDSPDSKGDYHKDKAVPQSIAEIAYLVEERV